MHKALTKWAARCTSQPWWPPSSHVLLGTTQPVPRQTTIIQDHWLLFLPGEGMVGSDGMTLWCWQAPLFGAIVSVVYMQKWIHLVHKLRRNEYFQSHFLRESHFLLPVAWSATRVECGRCPAVKKNKKSYYCTFGLNLPWDFENWEFPVRAHWDIEGLVKKVRSPTWSILWGWLLAKIWLVTGW